MIYDLVLFPEALDRSLEARAYNLKAKAIELRTMIRPSVAATCHQLQHEVLSYYFRRGTFTYTVYLKQDFKFYHRLSSETTAWLRNSGAADFKVHDVVARYYIPESDTKMMFYIGLHCLGTEIEPIYPREGHEYELEDVRDPYWTEIAHGRITLWMVMRQARNGWKVEDLSRIAKLGTWEPWLRAMMMWLRVKEKGRMGLGYISFCVGIGLNIIKTAIRRS